MSKCTEVWFSYHNKLENKKGYKYVGDNPYNSSGMFSRSKHWWNKNITITKDKNKYVRHHVVIIFLDSIKSIKDLYKIIIHETLHHVIHHINKKLSINSERVIRLLANQEVK